jgi:hypothetical protein
MLPSSDVPTVPSTGYRRIGLTVCIAGREPLFGLPFCSDQRTHEMISVRLVKAYSLNPLTNTQRVPERNKCQLRYYNVQARHQNSVSIVFDSSRPGRPRT